MGRPYLNQVVIAPHLYPPSITNNPKVPASGPELYMRLSRWGQCSKQFHDAGSWCWLSVDCSVVASLAIPQCTCQASSMTS